MKDNTRKKSKLGYTLLFEVIFGLYFIFLLSEPLLYLQTGGKTYGYRTETSDYSTIHNSRSKGTYSIKQSVTSYVMEYTYTVNNKEYNSSHISNMIIYPDPGDTQGYKDVYYNRLIPSFSVLCPVTLPYFLINNILFIITTIVLVVKISLNFHKSNIKKKGK